MAAESVGEARLRAAVGDRTTTLRIANVLFCPSLQKKLLSIPKLDDTGCRVEFRKGRVRVWDKNDTLIATGTRRGNLFYLDQAETANLVPRVTDFR